MNKPRQWDAGPPGDEQSQVIIEATCPLCGCIDVNVGAQELPLGQVECWDCGTIYEMRPDQPAIVIREGRRHNA